MYNNNLVLSVLGVCLLLLVSCASNSGSIEQEKKKYDDSDVPAWYYATGQFNSAYITAVSSATSSRKEFSRKNALLTARSKLAKRINSQVESVTFSFKSERREGEELSSESELLRMIKVATDENVANTEILEEKAVLHQDENRYETFVLIGVSKEEFKKAVTDKLKSFSGKETTVKEFEQKLQQQIDAM